MSFISNFEHSNAATKSVFPAMDGLRGIAILMVVFGHYWSIAAESFQSQVPVMLWNVDITNIFLLAGYGVQLFFVMSAFLLYLPYARSSIKNTDFPSIKLFYKRRFLRIYPAFFFCTLIGITIIYFLRGVLHIETPTLENIFSNLLFIQPITVFRAQSTVAPYLLEGTWSLVVEVYFYLLLPLLAIIFRKPLFLFLGALFLTAVAILYRQIVYPAVDSFSLPWQQKSTVLLNLTPYLDAFLLGMLAAYIFTWATINNKFTNGIIPKVLTYLGVVGIAYVTLFPFSSPRIQLLGGGFITIETNLLFNISTVFLILGMLLHDSTVTQLFSSKVVRFFGLVSYSLFLTHLSLARFLAVPMLNSFDLTKFEERFLILFIVFFPVSILLAGFFYLVFERPFFNKITIEFIYKYFKNLPCNIKKSISIRSLFVVLLCWLFTSIFIYTGLPKSESSSQAFATSNLTDSNWDAGVSTFSNMILFNYDRKLLKVLKNAKYIVLEGGNKVDILSVKVIDDKWIHIYLSKLQPDLMRHPRKLIIEY